MGDKLEMSVKGPAMIFRHDYNGKAFYKMSKPKMRDGEWMHGDISVYFKKGVEVQDKTKINIRSGWLDYYKKDKETVWYVFVNEFTFEGAPEVPSDFEQIDDDVPF